jgi:serine palmitoyltransferase
VDKGVSYAIQTGVKLSRAEIMWFEHNDMEDLERVLKKVREKDEQTKREITRRFIIIEGVYFNYGDVAPLPKIMELKEKYRYRVIMDDSYGIGVLGKSGRGTSEHYNIPAKDIDLLTGNLASVTSSVGGFCCATKPIIFHQRLNSTGYVYSASLPPLLAAASIAAFDVIDENQNLLSQLSKNIEIMVKGLSNLEGLVLSSAPISGILHLRLEKSTGDRYNDEVLLQQIVDECLAGDVLLTRSKYVHAKEAHLPAPSIRITVSAANTKDQLNQALNVIRAAASKVNKNRGGSRENEKESVGATKRTNAK